jgi:hypothetical protein
MTNDSVLQELKSEIKRGNELELEHAAIMKRLQNEMNALKVENESLRERKSSIKIEEYEKVLAKLEERNKELEAGVKEGDATKMSNQTLIEINAQLETELEQLQVKVTDMRRELADRDVSSLVEC